jgi:hypothetical protein
MAPVYKRDPKDIQADMYAYTMAAAHHNIKHVSLHNYMVSAPDYDGERAWQYIDVLKDLSCHLPVPKADVEIQMPTFLHAAHHFKACSKGDWPKDAAGSATCDMGQGSEVRTAARCCIWLLVLFAHAFPRAFPRAFPHTPFPYRYPALEPA